MAANTKNYSDQGGDTMRIGGRLIVESGGKLLLGSTELKQASAVADAAGTNVTAAEFKALLDALRAAGIIATATTNT